MRGRLVLDEPVHLVTRARPSAEGNHAGGRTGGQQFADLGRYAGRRWIAGCDRCRLHLITQCSLAGFSPKIAITTDDYVAVQALVAAGLGVATLPDLALRAARHPAIRTAELPGARRHVFALRYGEPPDTPATIRLIDALYAAAATRLSSGPHFGQHLAEDGFLITHLRTLWDQCTPARPGLRPGGQEAANIWSDRRMADTTRHAGRWTLEDQIASPWHYLPIEVPAGARAIRVRLSYDRTAAVLDLGCLGPDGFRGWSGGARDSYLIAADEATPGYLPGELEPGRWQVIIGLHRVPPGGLPFELTAEVAAGPGRGPLGALPRAAGAARPCAHRRRSGRCGGTSRPRTDADGSPGALAHVTRPSHRTLTLETSSASRRGRAARYLAVSAHRNTIRAPPARSQAGPRRYSSRPDPLVR